ncbi:MAG: endolytic transglycosylase MltG, partial [Clostridia bacterium]|nr:endolytic transglycosylase MltG [Clostridia bacterium]
MTSNKSIYSLLIGVCIAVLALACAYVALTRSDCSDVSGTTPAPSQQVQEDTIATVRVTFAEGLNVLQYGERLEENGVCSASDFYTVMNTVDFSPEFDFLPPMEELSDRTYYLEGYLFPDTYDFYVGEDAQSVIRRMLQNFGNRVTAEMRSAAATTGDFYNISL